MTRRAVPVCVLLAAAVIILVGGCGGDDDGVRRTPTPAQAPTPIPTLAPGVTPGPGVTDEQILLGMTVDVTGAGGTPYASIANAASAYFAALNGERGGVCGRELVLIIEDDRYLPDSALEATQKLVEEDGVLAVIGSLGTVQHIAVAEYLNDPSRDDDSAAGVPDLFVSTGWSAWSNPLLYPWTVAFIPDHATDGRALAQYINRSAPGQSVGVIYQDDDFGAEYRAAVRRTLHPNSSFTARAYSLDDDGEVDVREQLESLQADGVQVVVLATTPGVTATAYLAAEDMDYDPKFLLSYVNAVSPLAGAIGGGTTSEAISRGLEALDGTVVNMYLMSTFAHESEPAMEEHRRIMTAHRGPPVSSLSVYGQALAETVVETLNRSCSLLTREAVREAASSLQDFRPSLMLDTLEIEVRPDDQRAIRALQPVRIESDGTLTLLGEPASGE